MTTTDNLNAPWTLHVDHDGTEDIATIRDTAGADIVTSRPFWLPEGDDPVPPTLAAMRVMKAGPKLLEALEDAREWISTGEVDGVFFDEGMVLDAIDTAIAEATGRAA